MSIGAAIRLGVFAAWGVFLITWLVMAARAKENRQLQGRGSQLVQAVPMLLGAFLLATHLDLGPLSARLYHRALVPALVGVAITWLGIAFTIWSRITLGRNWSGRISLKTDHELVTHGPYRLARHPIYTGLLAAIVGSALCVGEVRVLLAIALLLFAMLWKIRLEEQWMEAEFGDRYREYRTKVKALIPFIL